MCYFYVFKSKNTFLSKNNGPITIRWFEFGKECYIVNILKMGKTLKIPEHL